MCLPPSIDTVSSKYWKMFILLLYYFQWTSTADATAIEIKSDLPTYTDNIKYGIHILRSTMKKKKVALNSWGEYDVFLWRRRCFQIVVLVCLLIQRREKAFTVFEPIVGYCDYIIVMLCIDEGLFTFFGVVLYGCLFLVLNIGCICSKMYLIECNTRLIRWLVLVYLNY